MSELSPVLKRILLEALILVMFAVAVGLTINYRMVMNAFSGKTVAAPSKPAVQSQAGEPAATVQQFPEPIEIDEIDELLAAGALLVDARNAEAYRQAHLQGAVSLPLGEADARLAAFQQQVPASQVLIVYCNGFGCPDSFDLGVILLKHGYQQVRVYEGGFPEWSDQGRPLEGGKR